MRLVVLVCAYFIFHISYLISHIPYDIWHIEAQVADARRGTPLIYWPGGIETAEALKRAGIEQIAAPPDKAAAWRKAGFKVVALSQAALARREKLLTPRLAGRTNVASATRRPWIDSNGWRFVRNPAGKFYYELPQGKAAMAMAEAFVYKADAILKIDPADAAEAGAMLAFIKNLPGADYPPIADIGVIDDGSPEMGEVMNLLTRRNLLFKKVAAPSAQLRVNIKLGSKEYPTSDAANPSDFAQKIRRQLGDENRTLRVYGTEIVICRLTGDGSHVRLHLLNYGGRNAESLRVRLRGHYGKGEGSAFGVGRVELEDFVNDETATEFSISKMGVYAVIDLPAMK
ncbi:MAG: hypothetical protein JMDDDDMK_01384 [Acidobacteria bacterium]|nr:hypothetical protein [Acidobacteriota bacterium]